MSPSIRSPATSMNDHNAPVSDEPSQSLEEIMMTEKSPTTEKRRISLFKLIIKPFVKRESDSVNTIFTDVDSSVNSSMMSMAMTSGPSGRIKGGCLKLTTQRDSVGMYYGPIHGNPYSVHWGSIEMHAHSMILGDNPCPAGPALSLSWKVLDTVTLPVDDYETALPPRRKLQQLVFPKSFRTEFLRESGYSRGELKQASDRGEEIRKHRERNARRTVGEKLTALSRRLRGKDTPSLQPLPHVTAQLSDSIRSVNFANEA